jgi:hypothetical protein
MNNKHQITLLVSVPVTVTYNTGKLSAEQISEEVRSEIKRTLMDHAEFFAREAEATVVVNEFSVRVDDTMPTNFNYD